MDPNIPLLLRKSAGEKIEKIKRALWRALQLKLWKAVIDLAREQMFSNTICC